MEYREDAIHSAHHVHSRKVTVALLLDCLNDKSKAFPTGPYAAHQHIHTASDLASEPSTLRDSHFVDLRLLRKVRHYPVALEQDLERRMQLAEDLASIRLQLWVEAADNTTLMDIAAGRTVRLGLPLFGGLVVLVERMSR